MKKITEPTQDTIPIPYNVTSQTVLTIPERAVQILQSHLGEHEIDDENMGPIVDWAIEHWTQRKADVTGWAKWCAGAVCTAYLEAGSRFIRQVASLDVAVLFRNLYTAGDVFFRPRSSMVPKVGDLVFFGLNHPTHVELCISFDEKTNKAITVGGNVSNAVRVGCSTSFYGFGRIGDK